MTTWPHPSRLKPPTTTIVYTEKNPPDQIKSGSIAVKSNQIWKNFAEGSEKFSQSGLMGGFEDCNRRVEGNWMELNGEVNPIR